MIECPRRPFSVTVTLTSVEHYFEMVEWIMQNCTGMTDDDRRELRVTARAIQALGFRPSDFVNPGELRLAFRFRSKRDAALFKLFHG